jgi:hypothetical protein
LKSKEGEMEVPAWGDYRQSDSNNGEECDYQHRLCEWLNLSRWSSCSERNASAEKLQLINETFVSLEFTGKEGSKAYVPSCRLEYGRGRY